MEDVVCVYLEYLYPKYDHLWAHAIVLYVSC